MITMSCQIQFVNVEVMVTVQLPKLAVYYIEMLVTKVCSHLINVFFLLEKLYNMEEVWPPKFWQCNTTTPWPVHAVVDTCNYLWHMWNNKHNDHQQYVMHICPSGLMVMTCSLQQKEVWFNSVHHFICNKVSPDVCYQYLRSSVEDCYI